MTGPATDPGQWAHLVTAIGNIGLSPGGLFLTMWAITAGAVVGMALMGWRWHTRAERQMQKLSDLLAECRADHERTRDQYHRTRTALAVCLSLIAELRGRRSNIRVPSLEEAESGRLDFRMSSHNPERREAQSAP